MKEVMELIEEAGLTEYFDMPRVMHESGRVSNAAPLNSLGDVIQWFDDEKANNHIFQKRVGLKTLKDWEIDRNGYLSHKDGKFFKVAGMKVNSPSREVDTWSQPILDSVGTGIIGLLLKKENNNLHFLMRARAEAGNRHIVQLGPTVEFNPGNYMHNRALKKPFLFEEFQNPNNFIKVWENRLSEEGGKFYKEEHLHRVLMLPDGMDLEIPSVYRWLSYDQVRFFLHIGESVNSCARSILACLV